MGVVWGKTQSCFSNGDLGIFENEPPPIFEKYDVGTYYD